MCSVVQLNFWQQDAHGLLCLVWQKGKEYHNLTGWYAPFSLWNQWAQGGYEMEFAITASWTKDPWLLPLTIGEHSLLISHLNKVGSWVCLNCMTNNYIQCTLAHTSNVYYNLICYACTSEALWPSVHKQRTVNTAKVARRGYGWSQVEMKRKKKIKQTTKTWDKLGEHLVFSQIK